MTTNPLIDTQFTSIHSQDNPPPHTDNQVPQHTYIQK